jgi:epoxide hydrolase
VAQLAWIVEKFHDWNKTVKTLEDAVGRDRLLTQRHPLLADRTATSSAQFYYESAAHVGKIFTPGVAAEPASRSASRSSARTGGSRSGSSPSLTPPSPTGRGSTGGGHFAAMEQPELYVGDLRTFVGSLDGR